MIGSSRSDYSGWFKRSTHSDWFIAVGSQGRFTGIDNIASSILETLTEKAHVYS